MELLAGALFLAIKMLLLIVGVLLTVAYLTWGERRVLARFQVRVGPNRTGPAGLIQPLADAVKLMGKEMLVPDGADRVLFRLAPFMLMVPAYAVYAFIPLSPTLRITDVNAGLLMALAVSSLGVYGIIIGGWSSNSKYSSLGSLRSAAQMISYEVSLMLAAIAVMLTASSMNLTEIVAAQEGWYNILRQPLGFLIFFAAGLAEINRLPFDLPEAESELTGGYHTEYSGMGFGAYYLGEYTNLLTFCLMTALLFLGGWNGPFLPGAHWLVLKTLALVFLVFWIRGTMLRPRADQLMSFGWKVLMPLAALNLLVSGTLKVLLP